MTHSYDNIGIIIPARFQSTRLPGKPLIDLCGKSMLRRTWERCLGALPSGQVYIATDDVRIAEHVDQFGGNVIMTSRACLTGTDRVAEANALLGFDLAVNVQGDEPIVDPEEIKKVIRFAKDNFGSVVCAYAAIRNSSEFFSLSIPKVVKTLDNDLLYMSRSPIPGAKDSQFQFGYKQICIYAFPKNSLDLYLNHPQKTPLESVEDVEILRFLERGVSVKLVETSGKSMAVDVEEDVDKVSKIIQDLES